jgi:hypothetical protein
MKRDTGAATYFITALILLAVGAGLYVGLKFLPYYIASQSFEEQMGSMARIYNCQGDDTDALRDAIYGEAQDAHLPIQRGDIQVEQTPSGYRVAVNYTVRANLGFGPFPLSFHPRYPKPKELVSAFDRGILGIIGFLLGLFWFFQGFSIFLRFKVVADTPVVPVRSVAMGLVQIHGKAVGEKTLLSPVSNQPCFLYKVDIERWVAGRQGAGGWQPYLTDWGSVDFYLDDETGRVRIDPRGSDVDVEQLYQCEINSREIVPLDAPWREEKPVANRAGMPAPDSELRSYVSRVALGTQTAFFQGVNMPLRKNVGSWRRKPRRRFGLSLGLLWSFIPMVGLAKMGESAAAGDYRLSESCVLPENEYDIIGTCTMNPHAQNDLDRQVISLGQNDKTFLISNQTEKSLEQDLHVRAWQHIIGGGLLAVAGAAVLLEALRLIM